MKKEYFLNINMKCPVCADTDFVIDGDQYTCNSCTSTYEKNELIEANSEEIEISKSELINDFKSDLGKDILKIFNNSKFFKVKK